MEKNCAQYVAGYIANRFASKYPELVHQTDENDCEEDCWTNFKSRGSLKLPSKNLMMALKLLEVEFTTLNGANIDKNKGIMKRMIDILSPKIEHLSIPQDVIDCCVRTRTFIRLNNLNKQITSRNSKKKEERRKKQKFIK